MSYSYFRISVVILILVSLESLDLGWQRLLRGNRWGTCPTLIHLPTLPHHALAAAVGALRTICSFGHRILTTWATTLARDTRLETWAVVVAIMSCEVGIEGGVVEMIIVPVRVKCSIFWTVRSFRTGVGPSGRGGRACVSCIRCGCRKWGHSSLISGWDISSVCSGLENEDDVRLVGGNCYVVNWNSEGKKEVMMDVLLQIRCGKNSGVPSKDKILKISNNKNRA